MAAGNEMRVSDAEREAAAADLREHFASGRLDQEELDQRLSAAFAARTRGDLSALFSDLPPGGAAQPGHGFRDAGTSPGPSGPRPFGGPSWSGPFGPRPGLGQGQPGDDGGRGRGNGWRGAAGRHLGAVLVGSVALWVLLIVGILGVFGIGTGRPLGIVLLIAAFALLRRLVFSIFGRRMGGGRGGRCGRRRR